MPLVRHARHRLGRCGPGAPGSAPSLGGGGRRLRRRGASAIRAQRWRLILRPVASVPFGPSFSATAIGFAASSVLPLRLGEFLRPALLARRVGFGMSPGAFQRRARAAVRHAVRRAVLPGPVADLSAAARPASRGAPARRGGERSGSPCCCSRSATGPRAERLLERRPRRVLPAVWRAASGRSPRGSSTRSVRSNRARIVGQRRAVLGAPLDGERPAVPVRAAGARHPRAARARRAGVDRHRRRVRVHAAGTGLPRHVAGRLRPRAELFGVPKDLAVGYSLLTWVVQMLVNVGLGGLFIAPRGSLAAPARARQVRRAGGRRPEGPP